MGVSATKNKYSPGSDNIAASIELLDENDIGVGGNLSMTYVLYLLFLSRISFLFISPSKYGRSP